MPLRIDEARETRDNHIAQVIGRLRPGVTLAQAQAEMEGIARQLETEFPGSNRGWGVTMSTVLRLDGVPRDPRRRSTSCSPRSAACC